MTGGILLFPLLFIGQYVHQVGGEGVGIWWFSILARYKFHFKIQVIINPLVYPNVHLSKGHYKIVNNTVHSHTTQGFCKYACVRDNKLVNTTRVMYKF